MAKESTVAIYYRGSEILNKNTANSDFENKLIQITKEIKEGGVLKHFFDLDGVIIPVGLETAINSNTLEQWQSDKYESVKKFKQRITSLNKQGGEFYICTGRGFEFAQKVASIIFPSDTLSGIIAEGGAIINRGGKIEPACSLNKESLGLLNEYKNDLYTFIKLTKGSIESGKLICCSFNPPNNTTTDEYKAKIVEFLKTRGIDVNDDENEKSLVVVNSATAVDILPNGIDKLAAMKQVVGNNGIPIYYGDAKNDETVMRMSVINVVPENGIDYIKDVARNVGIGIISKKGKEIDGVNEAMKLMEIYLRKSKQKQIKESGVGLRLSL